MQRGKHDQPLLSFSRELSVLRAPLPRDVSLYNFILFYIYSRHAYANIHFVKTHRHPRCPPPRKRTGGASSPFSGGKNRSAGFRSQRVGAGSDGKGRRYGLARLHSLHLIHLRFPRAQPLPLHLSGSGAGTVRNAGEKTHSSKRVFSPGAKHTQWKPLIMWAVAPLESRLCILHSQSDHRTNCVTPLVYLFTVWAGRPFCNCFFFLHTQSVT